MVAKRKAVTTEAALFGKSKRTKAADEEQLEGEQDAEVEDTVQEEEMSEKQKLKHLEEQEVDNRTQELKATAVSDIKVLVESRGMQVGSKADMIKALLAQEKKDRAAIREHESQIRQIIVQKKDELEALSVSELSHACNAIGLKATMTKQERIELLIKDWQSKDGVDNALVEMARNSRHNKLDSMDKEALLRLCKKARIDPYVQDVLVDRISQREHEMGGYSRPTPLPEKKHKAEQGRPADMVATLIQQEKNRKKEMEQEKQQKQAVADKLEELRAMTLDELKKALVKHGVAPAGKREDMMQALLAVRAEEEAVAKRKSELKALSAQELKDILQAQGLTAGGKAEMVGAILAQEAKVRQALRSYDEKVEKILAEKREQLEAMSNQELKELCAAEDLKLGATREDRVERLLEHLSRQGGEVDVAISSEVRATRKSALRAMSTPELLKLCDKTGADPLVKELMVEKLLWHEGETGAFAQEVAEVAAKKTRVGKK